MESILHFLAERAGATAIEYGLIGSMVSIVIVAAATGIGTELQTTFTTIQNSL